MNTKGISLPIFKGLGEKFSMYVIPVVVGIVVLGLLLLIVRPRVGAIFHLRKNISDAKTTISTLESKLTILQGYNYDQLLANVKKVEILLPSAKDLPSLLSNIERLSSESGVGIIALQLTPGTLSSSNAKQDAQALPVKLIVRGNFFQLKSFLGKLTTASRVIAVRSAALNSSATVASLSATLNVDSYYQVLGATKFKIDEPLQSLTPEEQKILSNIPAAPQPTISTQTVPSSPTGKSDPFTPF